MRIVENAFTYFDSSLQAGLVVNIVLGVVLGSSMDKMWTLIDTLQILTHVSLLNFVIPTNLSVCLLIVVQFSSLSVVPD